MKVEFIQSAVSWRLLCVALISLAALAGCGKREAPASGAPVKVSVITTQLSPISVTHAATGTVRSKTTIVITGRITANVMSVEVASGTHVQAGALLAQLDDRDAAAQMARAKALYDEAKAAVATAAEMLKSVKTAQDAADANAGIAKSSYERDKDLADKGIITRQQFENSEMRFTAASADALRAAQETDSAEAIHQQALARHDDAQAAVADAEATLGYTRITSPIAGVATNINMEVGSQVVEGAPLLTVEDDQHYCLEALVSEEQAAQIKLEDEAKVRFGALDAFTVSARVAEIAPASETSGSFTIKLDLAEGAQNIYSGMSGRAAFTLGRREGISVPAAAIIERGEQTSVFVVSPEKRAMLRLVKIGTRDAGSVEILSGLDSGLPVVTDGAAACRDGCSVSW